MGIRKKEMSTAFLGARGEGVLRVYMKIKDGTISGKVVGVYHGIKFSFTNRWPIKILPSKIKNRNLHVKIRGKSSAV